jgi:hypothetical protein
MIFFLTIYGVYFLINILYKNYKATQKHLFGMTQLTQKQPWKHEKYIACKKIRKL